MHFCSGEKVRFHHNGDFSGDVMITCGDQSMNVPFDDLKRLVAKYVALKRIADIELATDDEILVGPRARSVDHLRSRDGK